MASIELTGLVDPTQPLDPAARRALAARELKRFGPTPVTPADPTVINWADDVRSRFAGLENDAAQEILECVLDPAYSASERPAGVDGRIKVFVERAVSGSHLPDRMHGTVSCGDALAGHMSGVPKVATIWDLTETRVPCSQCLVHPSVTAARAITGHDRHRVNIRTEVLLVLTDLQHGSVHWPAVQRLANLGTDRWAPRFESGFVDTGNPERWLADPIAEATVELAVTVGHATAQHLAALWDAAMIEVLAQQASAGASHKIRRKAGKALAAAIEGHTWEELSGVVAAQIETALTRRKSVEKRVGAVLSEFEPEISSLVADELEALETPTAALTEWSSDLTADKVSNAAAMGSRLVMAWHGGFVPAVVLRAIQTYPCA